MAAPLVKILPIVSTRRFKIAIFHRKKTPNILFISHIATLQYYVKREKCKVNDVIFPSGCEALAINLGNKNMKICIFTGVTSVRSKKNFADISRYPTGKHEKIEDIWVFFGEATRESITDGVHEMK